MGVSAPIYRSGAGLSLWIIDNLPDLRPDDPALARTVEMARAINESYGWVNGTLTEQMELLTTSAQEQLLRSILNEIDAPRFERNLTTTNLIEWTLTELPHAAPNDGSTYVATRLAAILRKRQNPATRRHG
jgi:hypothetical protein